MRTAILSALIFLFGISDCSFAQTEAEVEQARLKGVDFLKSKQLAEGNWEYAGHEVGVTALCTLALIENGLPLDESVIQKGYRYVLKYSVGESNTYDIALSIVLLHRMGDRRDRARIRSLAARLIAGQMKTGGWHYTCPIVDPEVIDKRETLTLKEGVGDNSCTQFAVLGLWVASRSGVNIDGPLDDVADRFTKNQKMDGGWDYNHDEKNGSSPSMTTAGLFCLAVAEANKIRSQLRMGERIRRTSLLDIEQFKKGFDRTGEFAKGISEGSSRYYLWSVERVGVLLGKDKIGDVDWFQRGAQALIKSQTPSGSWTEGLGGEYSATSFAILFLRKANLGSDISRLLEGEPNEKFEILNRETATRFETLEEAVEKAKPGEIIRVNGNGPFPLKQLVLKQDINIQAGYGYSPIFVYELGVDRLGIKARPEKDIPARYGINIIGGDVTLEGLQIRMDPPALSGASKIPWGGISLSGGSLRLLNCSISEGNKRGSAGIVLWGDVNLTARNSFFVGGRAGIEVQAKGAQELNIENCVFFADGGVSLIPDPAKGKANVFANITRTVFHVNEAFPVQGVDGSFHIKGDRCIFMAKSIGLSFLNPKHSKVDRSFTGGEQNLYCVKQWIGSKGKVIPEVNDMKSWHKFWELPGGDSQESSTIPFAILRTDGAYSHSLSAPDWQLEAPESSVLINSKAGIDAYASGPGSNYDQFRDTFSYNGWKNAGKKQEAPPPAAGK